MTIDRDPTGPIGEVLSPGVERPTAPPSSTPASPPTSTPDSSTLAPSPSTAEWRAKAAGRDRLDGLPKTKRSAGRLTHKWSRLIHVYTSMIALLVVLFFAGTGLLLNHPSWTFGTEASTETITGEFPFSTTLVNEDGIEQGVDFLTISEYVRSEYGVIGEVDFFGTTSVDGSIAYRNPGYSADLFFDLEESTYELRVEQQGFVATMTDLHQGSESGTSWSFLIDVTASFLILISLTGLVMQFFLKKRRRSAYVVATVGTVLTVGLIVIALR